MALDRDTVVRTSLRVLNAVGLDGLTLRTIATELGVQPPALYWHFKHKQELVDEMATAMLKDLLAALLPGGADAQRQPWPEWLAVFARGLHEKLLGYRDGARMLGGTYLTDPAVFEVQESGLRAATSAGVPVRDVITGYLTVYSYTIGFTIEEQAVHPRPGERDPRYDPASRAQRVDATRRPLTATAGAELFSDTGRNFEDGLAIIMRGLRAPERTCQ